MLSFPLSGSKPSSRSLGTHPGYLAGRNYATWEGAVTTTAAIPAVDTIYFYPFRLMAPVTLTGGMVRSITGGAASSVKAGIWANSPVSHRPLGAPLIVDNTGAATTANNTNVALAMTGSLKTGIYWAGVKATGTLPQCTSIPAASTTLMVLTGVATGSTAVTCGLSFADAYANNMPTMAEGAAFVVVGTAGIPILYLTT